MPTADLVEEYKAGCSLGGEDVGWFVEDEERGV